MSPKQYQAFREKLAQIYGEPLDPRHVVEQAIEKAVEDETDIRQYAYDDLADYEAAVARGWAL